MVQIKYNQQVKISWIKETIIELVHLLRCFWFFAFFLTGPKEKEKKKFHTEWDSFKMKIFQQTG